jgi:hypothetical protein
MRNVPRAKLAAVAHNKARTEEQTSVIQHKLKKKEKKKRSALEAAGIDYDYAGYGEASKPKRQAVCAADFCPFIVEQST